MTPRGYPKAATEPFVQPISWARADAITAGLNALDPERRAAVEAEWQLPRVVSIMDADQADRATELITAHGGSVADVSVGIYGHSEAPF